MKSVALLFLLVLGVVSAELRELVKQNNLRVHQTPEAARLEQLSKLTPSNWPADGPWIVEVAHGTHASVLAAAKTLGGVATDTWEDDANSFNGMALSGLKRADLQKIAGVKKVHPDRVRHTMVTWGQDRIDQASRRPPSHSYTPAYQGCGVDVYIIDTGMDTLHPEFNNGGREVQNIYNAFGPITDNTDGHAHGTHVAGTVGGKTVGVSPCANIYALKALSDEGYGSDKDVITAIKQVKKAHKQKRGKSVLSMSLGGACAGDCMEDGLLGPIQDIMNFGVVVSLAAGNEHTDAATTSPAFIPDAITVGASTDQDKMAYFSNFGAVVDIFAPGKNILSACSSKSSEPCDADGFLNLSGTSMACPHVSGAVAQFLQASSLPMRSNSDVQQIRNQLVNNAVSVMTGTPDTTTKALLQVRTTF